MLNTLEHLEVIPTTTPDQSDLAELSEAMRRYSVSILPNLSPESEDQPIAALIRDVDGRLIGGIQANIYWDGLEVEVLWVDDEYRQHGLGSKLLTAVEHRARDHGAVVAHLKTVMARAFYEKHQYVVYGVLEDRPIGTSLYHMKKRLDRT